MNRSQRRAAARSVAPDAPRRRKAAALGSAAVLASAGAGAALVLSSSPAGANAPIVVDSLTDDGSGGTTLREAILQANTDSGKDTITFSVTGTITLTANLPTIVEALDLVGPGESSLTVDGDDSFAGFYFGGISAAGGTSSLSGMTITGMSTTSIGPALNWSNSDAEFTVSDVTITGNQTSSNGGAVEIFYNTGSVTLERVTVTDNQAGINGGGLYSDTFSGAGFELTIIDSVFSDNAAVGHGGGLVLNTVDVTIIGTEVSGNVANDLGGGGIWIDDETTATITGSRIVDNRLHGAISHGGGIAVRDADAAVVESTVSDNSSDFGGGAIGLLGSGSLLVERSTLAGNSAGYYGGALYLRGSGGAVIVNSTISGNTANQAGGIYSGAAAGLTLLQSTITGNEATGPDAVHGVQVGGGVVTCSDAVADCAPTPAAVPVGAVALVGTILAGNGDLDLGVTPDHTATVGSQGSILGAVAPGVVAVTDLGGSQTGVSAAALKLGPLADNGGPTLTHALLAGSPAIDAGPNPPAEFPDDAWDQRGEGYARVVGGKIDVGAFEVQPPAPDPVPEPTFTG